MRDGQEGESCLNTATYWWEVERYEDALIEIVAAPNNHKELWYCKDIDLVWNVCFVPLSRYQVS